MLSVTPVEDTLEATLREVVEALAVIERPPCSAGERQAAEWLAARLRAVPGVEVALEDEPSWGIFAPTVTGLGLLGMVAAALTLRGRRVSGALLAVGTLAGIVDEAQNGPRLLRRLVRRRRTTVNLVARIGPVSREAGEGAGVRERETTRRGATKPGARERGARRRAMRGVARSSYSPTTTHPRRECCLTRHSRNGSMSALRS